MKRVPFLAGNLAVASIGSLLSTILFGGLVVALLRFLFHVYSVAVYGWVLGGLFVVLLIAFSLTFLLLGAAKLNA